MAENENNELITVFDEIDQMSLQAENKKTLFVNK